MLYDLINPSDPVTFLAPSQPVAALVSVLLGRGQYGATALGGDGEEVAEESVPLFLFGGFDEFWAGLDVGPANEAVQNFKREVIEALETVSVGDRRLFDSALASITEPDKRKAFVAEWNDRKRSSMNNIMARAHAIAVELRGDDLTDEQRSTQHAPQHVFTS